MSSKTVQTSTQQQQQQQSGSNASNWANQFAPGSMANYQAMQGAYVPGITNLINNPFNNPIFNATAGMTRANIGQQGAGNVANLQQMAGFMGGGASPFMASNLARLGRSQSGQQAGAYNNLLLGGWNQRLQALGMAG